MNRRLFQTYFEKKYTSGAEILINQLLKNKCHNIFLYSGGANLGLLNEIKNKNIPYVMNINEQCSGHCAAGYSKSSNKIGVVLSTSGPGVTNLVTAVLDAKNDSVPLIVITGQVPTSVIGSNAFQECPSVNIMKNVTKKSIQIKNIKDIKFIIDEAYYIAKQGKPGPVHIDCPKDIMSQEILVSELNNISKIFVKPKEKKYLEIDKLQQVNELISKSQKPIIITGQGGIEASDVIRKLAKKINIPITTTIHGMGIYDETEDLSLEMLGMHGSAYANYGVQEADLILAIGYRFCDRTTGNIKNYAINAKKAGKENKGGIIHFNIDDNEFNKIVDSKINLSGDCLDNLNWILKNYNESKKCNKWLNYLKSLKKKYPFKYSIKSNEIKTQSVIEKFYEKTKDLDNILITTGVGNHQMMAAQFYKWKYPKRIITSGSLGTMGVGLPFAIGSQLSNPNKNIFCIDGDSSFNMTLNELATLSKLNLPIKILIMNDGRQQMVHVWQKLFFNENYIATENNNPNYCELAKSFGIDSFCVSNNHELETIFDNIINYNKPVLVEFKVTPDICLPLIPPGNNLDQMIINNLNENKIEGIAPS